ncbi:nuclear transport factor 2 family protein [Maritimibacter sp. HL-12]|jgi:limonene-1,2-epoxide hydrolase|uniref:nuclear transport factor 2 family protein n=1 Tax=Maritimibacter sp. HL-12 TaxID=1162418 RepID=UPI000A0F3957|nr:nuclear transport factor 2 family protein [Maritimibacter sp. HL-12]SMH54321.1 SnoaL-like domain-containing protein [Maritimibacter sp. HL-12]
MSMQQMTETARAFLRALEDFDTAALAGLVHPRAQRIEFPNRLKPDGGRQKVTEMLAEADRAKALLTAQSYEVNRTATGDALVIMELTWRGTLAAGVGGLSAGDVITAHCVAAFDFEGDRIVAVRNYDCFEAF